MSGGARGPAGTDSLRQRSCAGLDEWPLRSSLELGALPTAVGNARLHARQVLRAWGLSELSENVELVTSELVTNSVRACEGLTRTRHDGWWTAGVPAVWLWLCSDRQRVLVQVWDGNDQLPERKAGGLEAESGRGLLLVDALSAEWGAFAPEGWTGKIVWAMVTAAT